MLAALLLATSDARLPDVSLGKLTQSLAAEELRGSDHAGIRRQLLGTSRLLSRSLTVFDLD